MKQFTYVIKDKDGIHARPAGLLIKEARKCKCDVTISKGNNEVDAKRIFGVMSLGAKQGDQITVTTSGEDEEEAMKCLMVFMEENL